MDKQILNIDFTMPKSWLDLSEKQLKYIYQLFAADYSTEDCKIFALFRWNGVQVIGRQPSGDFLLKKGKQFFEVSSVQIAEILPALAWMDALPPIPIRVEKIRGCKALPESLEGVPFEQFIICDNLYQGYLTTGRDELLDAIGAVLYGKEMEFRPYERISIFYWFASLKEMLSRLYPDFFQPVGESRDGNLLGSPSISPEAAMNAQIRALTKGDITKEKEVLQMDMHRALVELDAQARDYKEINSKIKSK